MVKWHVTSLQRVPCSTQSDTWNTQCLCIFSVFVDGTKQVQMHKNGIFALKGIHIFAIRIWIPDIFSPNFISGLFLSKINSFLKFWGCKDQILDLLHAKAGLNA